MPSAASEVETLKLIWSLLDLATRTPAFAACVTPLQWLEVGTYMALLIRNAEHAAQLSLKSTLGGEWEIFRKDVIPPGAPPIQLVECRRAFYAGAHAALQLMATVGDSGVSEETGAAYVESLMQECRGFAMAVKRGEA